MCGRFVQSESARHYAEYFRVDVVKMDDLAPCYNVAPTDTVYAVAEHEGERLLGAFRWGLIPWWAKDRKVAARMVNARMETIATKAAFSDAFGRKRCLIPADGFYEWQRRPDGKLPHFIYSSDRRTLAFAGLWSSWKDPDTGERVRTCTIVTGEPDDLVEPIHDRMPVALTEDSWSRWLDPANRDPEELSEMLHAAVRPQLAEHPVSSLVNKVANNIPELIDPLETGAVTPFQVSFPSVPAG